MRALIIGGGIAGTTTALALQKAGWEPVVYEAYEHSAGLVQGAFLTIAANGLDALAAIDAADAVQALGFPTGKIRFTSGAGKDLGAMDIAPRLASGVVTRTVRRAELYATLAGLATDRGIEIVHGRRLVGASMAGGQVTATFGDGTSAVGERSSVPTACVPPSARSSTRRRPPRATPVSRTAAASRACPGWVRRAATTG